VTSALATDPADVASPSEWRSGGTRIRHFTLAGDLLSLRTPPIEVAGDVVVNELWWQRQESW